MDNLTHTLTAIALSQAGLNRTTRFATLALVLGSNLPDIDLVTRLVGATTYLRYHRGLTESILGVVGLAALLAAALNWVGRKIKPKGDRPPLNGRWLFGVCLIATTTHFFMDFANPYGVRPFFPFSGRWYAWDIMFTVDPLLLGLLAAGLGLPAILRLVSEEVGARTRGVRRGAIFCLSCVVVLFGVRDLSRRRVLGWLESHTYGWQQPWRVAAFPAPANPFAWTGVVETESAFHVLPASALDDDVIPEKARVFPKPAPSPALDAAMETYTARVFVDFARFLWVRTNQTEVGFTVTLRDLRYFSLDTRDATFVARITLDKELRVQSESLSFSGQVDRAEL